MEPRGRVLYVLEGEIELRIGDEVSTVGPGSFAYLPKGTPHTFKNAGTTPAKLLGMGAPAGFEKFFEEVGEIAVDPSSSPAGPTDVKKMMATASKYSVEIPPPSGG